MRLDTLHHLAFVSGVAGLVLPSLNQFNLSSCARDHFQVVSGNESIKWPHRTYVSSSALPPQLNITTTGRNLQPGLILFGQENAGAGQTVAEEAALVMTDKGDLVYSLEGQSSNFRQQTLHNQSVITTWSGSGAAAASDQVGYGYGVVRILDSGYNEIFTVCPKVNVVLPSRRSPAECVADVHESYITENNTMLVTVHNVTQADLTDVGGPQDGWVLDSLAIEVDINTNETLFVWSPWKHVPLNSSHLPLDGSGLNESNPYDFFHMNSIQSYKGGFLINGRHTWTSYFVNRNGDVEWQVNGEDGGDFGALPDGAHYSWEHHARIEADPSNAERTLLHVFANDDYLVNQTNPSIGLSFSFIYPPSRDSDVTLHRNLSDPAQPLAVFGEGANNPLANGNSFLGYGYLPFMKEYGPTGEVLWSAQFGLPGSAQSYRAFKQDWHARPTATKPSLVVLNTSNTTEDALTYCSRGSDRRGFVSWNGATDVTGYNIYAGGSADDLSLAFVVPKLGFETEFVVPAYAAYVQVGAVEGYDDEVSRSEVLSVA